MRDIDCCDNTCLQNLAWGVRMGARLISQGREDVKKAYAKAYRNYLYELFLHVAKAIKDGDDRDAEEHLRYVLDDAGEPECGFVNCSADDESDVDSKVFGLDEALKIIRAYETKPNGTGR